MINEINRLEEQAESWKAETGKLLDLVQLKSGWACADMGCGPRGILDLLSEGTGKDGLVVGLDFRQDFLLAAKEYIEKTNLGNVQLLWANLFDMPIEANMFDLTHVRFVFSEIGCDNKILDNMISVTKPGGLIVSQEADLTTWHCHPPQEDWQKLKDILIRFYESLGRDINAGLRTCNLFKRAGLMSVRSREVDLDLTIGNPYRPGLLRFIESHRKAIKEAGIAGDKELDEIFRSCQEIVDNAEIEVRSYTLHQVWGRVPKTSD